MIKPRIRGGICMNANPGGCAREVVLQKELVEQTSFSPQGPKTVLVIGGSTGYGLAARLVAGFGYKADTISVSFEKEPNGKRPATPGWYNTRAFDLLSKKEGRETVSINADAFAHETRKQVGDILLRKKSKIDLLIYSLASGVRPDPDTGKLYRSTLKPFGKTYTTRSVDFMSDTITTVSLEPANEEETAHTVKVMGGEDWQLWVDYLREQGLLADRFKTVAFSYIGPEVTHPIYRDGTIGKAKEHLEATARSLHENMASAGGEAYVSINKAVVTRASAVIPAVPLYISLLFSVMKEKGLHEGCVEQMIRMFRDRLYTGDGGVPVDESELIRLDDLEMRDEVQSEVDRRWNIVTEQNLEELADMQGFRDDFLRIHGFAVPGVDYEEKVDFKDIPEL